MGEVPVQWNAEALWEAVSPLLPTFTVEILPAIASTNTELMRRARAGQLEPTLLVAERQTAGRGRLGRDWQSDSPALSSDGLPQAASAPSGGGAAHALVGVGALNLTFSLGLPLALTDWSGLSLAVGLSVVQSLHPELRLKWPNDLWLGERKLAGILIETVSVDEVRFAVIGIGINIAPRAADGLRTPPAALTELWPGATAPLALARVVLPLVQALQAFEREGFAPLRTAFHARDLLYGQQVQCSDGVVGTARGVDAGGALLVHTDQGLKKISSAEVSVRPVADPSAPPS